jgi:hypothetical protein
MSNLFSLTSTELKRAADLKDKIAALEKQLAALLGSPAAPAPATKKKFKMSAAGKAKIRAAQKVRWAKVKGLKPAAQPVIKRKNKISAAGRARIAAAAKARWAKAKAAGKKTL